LSDGEVRAEGLGLLARDTEAVHHEHGLSVGGAELTMVLN